MLKLFVILLVWSIGQSEKLLLGLASAVTLGFRSPPLLRGKKSRPFYVGATYVVPQFQQYIRAVTASRSYGLYASFVIAPYNVTFIQGTKKFPVDAGLYNRLCLNLINNSETAISQFIGRRPDCRHCTLYALCKACCPFCVNFFHLRIF